MAKASSKALFAKRKFDMKLRIWQQFGSNHSNDFTIVGRFASEGEAAIAAKRLDEIFRLMLSNSTLENYQDVLKVQFEKLGLAWQHKTRPDWLSIAPIEIKLYDKLLFIEVYNNWSSHQPLDLLLDKLGSENTGIDSEEGDFRTIWTFDFDILDAEKADAFELLVLEILTRDESILPQSDYEFPDMRMGLVDWRREDDYKRFALKFSRNGIHFQLDDVDFWLATSNNYGHISSFNDWLKDCGTINIHAQMRNK
jgi:hypothetical protein